MSPFFSKCSFFKSLCQIIPIIRQLRSYLPHRNTHAKLSVTPPSPPSTAQFLVLLCSLKQVSLCDISDYSSPVLAKPTLVRLSPPALPDSPLVKVTSNLQVAQLHGHVSDLILI